MKPKQKSDLINQNVEGESLILNNQGAEVHQLNPVASLIWENCDGLHTIQNITDILLQEYDALPEQALSDVTGVISQFKEKGLLENE